MCENLAKKSRAVTVSISGSLAVFAKQHAAIADVRQRLGRSTGANEVSEDVLRLSDTDVMRVIGGVTSPLPDKEEIDLVYLRFLSYNR